MIHRICLMGMIASGKSTLARSLASKFGYDRVSDSYIAKKYLADLFANPSRFALEAQIAFVVEKSLRTRECEAAKISYVVERSFFEDRKIFYTYFHEHGFVDSRANALYERAFAIATDDLPSADLTILCECTVEETLYRIGRRNLPFSYPDGHIDWLLERYSQLKDVLRENGGVYTLSSSDADWSQASVAAAICQDVAMALLEPDPRFQLLCLLS